MVEWFSGARADSIDGLIAGRRYGKAIDLIRSELIKFRYGRLEVRS